MNKYFLKLLIVFFICFSSISYKVFGNDIIYDQCIKNADIGDYDGAKDFDGVKLEDIEIKKSKSFCLSALEKFPNDIKILRSLARIFYKEEKFKDAYKFYKKSSELGDAFSYYGLFRLYYWGEGIQKNYDKAFTYIKKAADENFIYALERIGELYKWGHGTPIDLDKSFESYKKCSDYNIEWCLLQLSTAFEKGILNQKKDQDKKLYYINKLIEIDSPHGYSDLGQHLLDNAKSELDIRNALLNLKQAGEWGYGKLLNLYLFPQDYPIYFKMYPNKEANRKKGISILNAMIDNTNSEDYDVTVRLIGDGYFARPYYTQVFTDQDFKNTLSKLKQIYNSFVSNEKQVDAIDIKNSAARALGNYYYYGYYIPKDLKKAEFYYSIAADRNDFLAAISAGWAAYKNKNYKKAFHYNNIVTSKSNDPEYTLYALNNNGVVDNKLYGSGTNFQIENFKKAAEIVDKFGYFVEWPYSNLSYLYYLPINNLKKENFKVKDIQKSKFYHTKLINLLKENGETSAEENDLLYFLYSKFKNTPKDLEEAAIYLEYAALNGYKEGYYRLALLYQNYRDKEYNKEIYKWYKICSVISEDDTKDSCRLYLKEIEIKLSYFERVEIEKIATNYVLDLKERQLALNKQLGFDKKEIGNVNNQDFGNYHALLIGVNDYKHFQDLRTPINDINRLDKILSIKYKFTTKKLINPSRRNLLKQLNSYTKSLSKNDNLIIYFAGHGMQKSDEGFWLTSEAEKDDDIDWISNNTIVRKLREIKANNILVVADSCFSGLLTRGLNLESNNINKSPLEVLHNSKSRIAITSGGNEPVLDGGGGENSIFAASLASELENRSKAFTASELFLNIQKRVIKETLAFGIKQSPIILDIPKSGHESFDFVFNPN